MTVELGWPLAVALLALVALGMTVAHLARLPVRAAIGWAAVRAGLQLMVVSLIVGFSVATISRAERPSWSSRRPSTP